MTFQQKSGRHPIREAPLRDPGESLRDQRERLLHETAFPWLVIAVWTPLLAAFEWGRWWFSVPPMPILLSILAAVVVTMAYQKWLIVKEEAENIRIGLRGERHTGQYLQSELLPLGYHVFHDCCFDDFNVDHVAIGPGGVFAIETKTRTKLGDDDRVTYDGETIKVNGFEHDRDPVKQVRAGAASIQKVLLDQTGGKATVRPVVLFPGWWVERQPKGAETWVLNPKAFLSFVNKEPIRLTPNQVSVLSAGLARYIRSTIDE